MRRFAALYAQLDATTRTTAKVAALVAYFRAAPPADAAWALRFLTGEVPRRAVPARTLLRWAGEASALPTWLSDECYDAVGDLAETITLLLPPADALAEPPPLHQLITQTLLPLQGADETRQREVISDAWCGLDSGQRLVFHKLITGVFRVGVARTLVVRALAEIAGIPPAVMAHRMSGGAARVDTAPTAEAHLRLLAGSDGAVSSDDAAKPYPFFLAHPLPTTPEELGLRGDWQVEWKWDGIRSQLLRRGATVALWSRGEDLIGDAFPELIASAAWLPTDAVLDGEVLAWTGDAPLPFASLQRRLNRKRVSAKMQREVPVVFLAYDLLEVDGVDWRGRTLAERRARLEQLIPAMHPRLRLSPIVSDDWPLLTARRDEARARGVEGLMLKRRDAPYGVGRITGAWWKWKIAPFELDAVLVYAQRGHGRRAGLYTDYTFAVWRENADGSRTLVPVAKAYSGLTDAEIRDVDRFIRGHTTETFGPVRAVTPELVFTLHFEGIQISKRHQSGIAVRFPRMARMRPDKRAADADTLGHLRALADLPVSAGA